MPIEASVSSEMTPAVRISFFMSARCNRRAIDPDNIRKGERLTFDVESIREGKIRASNVRRGG
jgi:hypothetical protein